MKKEKCHCELSKRAWQSSLGLLLLPFLALSTACGNVSNGQSTTSSLTEQFSELIVALDMDSVSGKGEGDFVLQFFDNAEMTGTPTTTKIISDDLTGIDGDTDRSFSIIGLDKGSYYLRVFFDEDADGTLDTGELNGVCSDDGVTMKIKLKDSSRKAVLVSLSE